MMNQLKLCVLISALLLCAAADETMLRSSGLRHQPGSHNARLPEH